MLVYISTIIRIIIGERRITLKKKHHVQVIYARTKSMIILTAIIVSRVHTVFYTIKNHETTYTEIFKNMHFIKGVSVCHFHIFVHTR